MKKYIPIIMLAVILLLPSPSTATDVGGIISSNTVWDLAHSPYTIISQVQIADGVTLTIQPGVVVSASDVMNGLIKVWGTLKAIGTSSQNITFNQIQIQGENGANVVLNIQFAHLISTGISNTFDVMMLMLLDSKFEGSVIGMWGVKGDSYIERNVFTDSFGSQFCPSGDNTTTYVRNNLFYQWKGDYAVGLCNYSGMSNSQIVFEYNSFLTTGQIALEDYMGGNISLPGYTFNPEAIVTNNYWGTTDTSVIDSMIYDRHDDLEKSSYFIYQPFLTQPHPNTPPFADFIANPTSGKNGLNVIFTDQSSGIVTSRLWDFGDGGTSTEENPSHTYASAGTFTVSLTVVSLGGSDTEIKNIIIRRNAMPSIPLLLLED
jgi:PKD domain